MKTGAKKGKTRKNRVTVGKLKPKKMDENVPVKEQRAVKGGLAVDPSDPSGNTVYVSGASGGVWKATSPKLGSK